MRELTSHKVNGLNEALTINAIDEPGAGGANHQYLLLLPPNAKLHNFTISHEGVGLLIPFQKGPIAEAGVNGISGEALLAIVEDRLKCFQDGDYACRENALALTHIQEAMHWLHHRTRERLARGVE